MADIISSKMADKPELQQDLAGKVALVTGASRGIGRAIALQLASRGASVLGTCSSTASVHHIESIAQEVQELYKSSGHCAPVIVGIAANVLAQESPLLIAETIENTFDSKLDIVINNAAYYEFRQMGELDADYVDKLLLGNVHNLIMLMETCFKKGLIQPNSRIVNVSSDTTRTSLPFPEMFVFTCTKAAMESLTRSWSDILSRHETTLGTTVNTLAVGPTATDALLNAPVHLQTRAAEVLRSGTSVAGGVGHPQDIADIVGLLVSEKSRWINGSVVCATGGLTKIL
ncbi:short-chain dehydrogenase [Beauveria bassiana ARSEF 2860]|uniref:Short-chain dehydrogenase n=1 Tax=Beauveria bassiana (strain ARSEF 2860) TaxID=655819 RepID=J4VU65_BEAB2|nr:short-chain dehydrogenase [Beauveria bassiana ARSEF 2860]EJP62065.1 short-chain dehydrogenase [Beauveria bassiana ARSEF 2860]